MLYTGKNTNSSEKISCMLSLTSLLKTDILQTKILRMLSLTSLLKTHILRTKILCMLSLSCLLKREPCQQLLFVTEMKKLTAKINRKQMCIKHVNYTNHRRNVLILKTQTLFDGYGASWSSVWKMRDKLQSVLSNFIFPSATLKTKIAV